MGNSDQFIKYILAHFRRQIRNEKTIKLFARFLAGWQQNSSWSWVETLSYPLQTLWEICKDKMAEKSNQEANSQSSKLVKNELQKLEE